MFSKPGSDIFGLVVYRRLDPAFAGQPVTFFFAAGDANNAQTLDAPDLCGSRAGRAGGRGGC